jgi:tetratricopeptide (TPR) repeat protein
MANADEKARIEILIREAKVDEASAAVDALLAANPADADGLTFGARLLASQGDIEAGLVRLNEALDSDPNHIDAQVYKAALLIEMDEDDAAQALLEGVVQNEPEISAAHFNLGRLFARKGLLDEAHTHLGQARRLDPENAFYTFAFARVLAERGEVQASIGGLMETVKMNPTIIEAWVILAMLQGEVGDSENAYNNIREGLKHNPDEVALFDALVSPALATGHLDEALDAAQAVVKALPDHAAAQVNLGNCFIAAQRFADAEKTLRHALTLDPQDPRGLHALGMLLEATETEEGILEAMALFERAIASAPDFWKPYNDLGLILTMHPAHQDLIRGAELLAKAVSLTEENLPSVLFNLALAHAKMGNEKEAKLNCDKVQLHPQAPEELKAQAAQLAQAATVH